MLDERQNVRLHRQHLDRCTQFSFSDQRSLRFLVLRWIDIQSLQTRFLASHRSKRSWLFKHRMNINSLGREGRGDSRTKTNRPSFRMCRVLLHRVIFFNFLSRASRIPTRRFRKEIDAFPPSKNTAERGEWGGEEKRERERNIEK